MMKKFLSAFFSVVCFICAIETDAQLTEFDENRPIGWASTNTGTTGAGDDADYVVVETMKDFVAAMSGTSPLTIYVKGTLETLSGLRTVQNVENKTVYGLPGACLVNKDAGKTKSMSGILRLKGCRNIIIRNLTFKAAGAYDMDGNDNMEIYDSHYVWIDHCDFQDGVDGNMDCNNGSNNISITWCRFRYLLPPRAGGSGGSADHRFSNLWGSADNSTKDNNRLNTTFANCWWDQGCRERMPRVRYGKVHMLNCYFSSTVSNYCVGGGYKSNVVIEACYFKNQNYAWKKYATSSGYTDYNVVIKNCVGAKDKEERSGTNEYFVPSDEYEYNVFSAEEVESFVSNPDNGAGATLNIVEGELPAAGSASSALKDKKTALTRCFFYTMEGRKVAEPQRGLNIVRRIYADGVESSELIMIR